MSSTVSTRSGQLEGESFGGGVRFRGVPFAKPPIGPLRFRAPEPPEPWTGVRDARDYAPSAPQIGPVNRIIRGLIGAAGSRQSQDCLYLNVWTPKCDGARRPVMVWLHGGAFILGSGSTSLYSGEQLATRGDVVVVTLNYRLGALGFLSWKDACVGSDVPPANLGLRDQILALAWVRDNVEAFGGDPENVTVFGESAGAMSIGTLLGVPSARGLFHKAILQSGAAHNVSTPEKAAQIAAQFFELLGIDAPSPEALAEIPVTRLMEAQARATVGIGLENGMMAWQPCIDGDLIPENPLAAIDRGDARDVPILIGTNRDEYRLFTFFDRDHVNDAQLASRVRRIAHRGQQEDAALAERILNTYGPPTGTRDPGASERWIALQGDRIFHFPATRLADAQSVHQPMTHAYLFEWTLPLVGGGLGACHGLDLPFVFGATRSGLLRVGLVANRAAARLADVMQDAWVAFARTGVPAASGLPDWPAYETHRRYTMTLGGTRGVVKDPHEAARAFWAPLIPNGEVGNG
ncbi:MAG: carboxylesterase/lipase family protein [Deltaproteobacteria bacterium]|nr:carboxylesterase/lipase family protein [Deltaproteobacteria bacterium]